MLELWTIRTKMLDGTYRSTRLLTMLEKLDMPGALGRNETGEVQGIIDVMARRFEGTVEYIEALYDGNLLLSTRQA